MRGVSRSASVVIAFLVASQGLSRDEAYVIVRRRRPLASPNLGFWEQLGEFAAAAAARGPGALLATGAGGPSEGSADNEAAVIDEAWCRQSCASFHMGPAGGGGRAGAGAIAAPRSPGRRRAALLAGLDYVLGRSLLPSDVAWLKALCDACDDAGGSSSSKTGSLEVASSGVACSSSLGVSSEELLGAEVASADFLDCWGCDFKPRLLASLLAALRPRKRPAETIAESDEEEDEERGEKGADD
jgi:hypothetical protein